MKYNLLIKEEAQIDINESFIWYNEKSTQISDKFISELNYYFSIIMLNPYIYAEKYDNLRFAVMKKFPFVIIFEIEEKNIIIYSVFHTSRNPKKLVKYK